jgi:hypothetical protein
VIEFRCSGCWPALLHDNDSSHFQQRSSVDVWGAF